MKRKELLLLAIGIFLTVIASLVADIYHLNTETKLKTKETVPQFEHYKIDKGLLSILEQKTE